MLGSIALGKTAVPLSVALDALTAFDHESREHLLIRTVRLPRALIAMTVGACLAMAGAVMQAITRNPLAGPELFGVSQGAALLVVLHIFVWGGVSPGGHIGFAFLGAGLAGLAVYVLGSIGGGGLTPLKLILAGSVINLLFASLTQGILVFDEQSLDTMRFWLAGSLTGRNIELFYQVLPFMLTGLIGTLALSKQVNVISLGEDAARSLGLRTEWVKAGSLLAVVVLAGSSVAIAGPIGFVGLAVPHIVRSIAGPDYRWVIPYSAVAGAVLLLLADIAARFAVPAQEVPAGIVTALLGAPFLIYLAQRRS
ncbi:FecCD family ABC transporter permease [Paenibacillus flagellatus]|uniref:FecCD family ABC transporter permease n=1 Tax=Paenibacillus flagellatus TaxID=2211139 RepID=UPI001FE9CE71|nr:iron ABC transporter permease [Paenibacillus flagellatus]